jgi:hypothetical protein
MPARRSTRRSRWSCARWRSPAPTSIEEAARGYDRSSLRWVGEAEEVARRTTSAWGRRACAVYEPLEPSGGTLVWIHGGGWIFGQPDLVRPRCAARCATARAPRRLRRLPPGARDAVPRAARRTARRRCSGRARVRRRSLAGRRRQRGRQLADVLARRPRRGGPDRLPAARLSVTDAAVRDRGDAAVRRATRPTA